MPHSPAELTPLRARGKFFHDGAGKWFAQGVTYGPFAPGADGEQMAPQDVVERDFAQMRELGVNLVRVYHPPARWLLDAAAAHGLRVLAAAPWTQHAETLHSYSARRQAERTLRKAVASCAGHPAMAGWMVGTEIAANVVRWVGAGKVRAFLERLIDAVHAEDPRALASYASFPPTEYLIPRNADFLTFNVFLERRADYARYLSRLHNLADGRPLLIGEFGLDTLRNGEERQAETLAWQHEETMRSGGAGTILFSWTDEWYNGGQMVDDWQFGLVTAARAPKAAYAALRPLLTAPPIPAAHAPLARTPTVSVIVCAYNAADTLPECLRALDALRYAALELVVVDDGSTDGTRELLAQWNAARPAEGMPPSRIVTHEKNRGLSAARNMGAQVSTGEILAYTDADCEPDPDWIYHLVATLTGGDYAGAGGPNIPPPAAGSTQAAVAASPGGPTHVLLTDTIAEHIPGCNMAFWRWAFDAVQGFDPAFRRAGDDVDFCWRIQSMGGAIAFSPGALVWHHRRCTVDGFLSQQSGYGEAEALLRFKHPIFFTAVGSAKWRGAIYGAPRLSWWFSQPVVYHGALGQGTFQSMYPAPISTVAAYMGSIEWLAATAIAGALSGPLPWLRVVPVLMLLGPVAVAASWMAAAHIELRHDTLRGRLLVASLAFLQPLVRGWSRWKARLFPPAERPVQIAPPSARSSSRSYWSETGAGRDALLAELFRLLDTEGWRHRSDSGWGHWDVLIHPGRWFGIAIHTVTDDHGRGKCLTRIRTSPRPTLPSLLGLGGAALLPLFQVALSPYSFLWWAVLPCCAVLLLFLFVQFRRARGQALALVARAADFAKLTPVK